MLAQLSATLASADAYAASLTTGALPTALVEHIEAALAAPFASPARLEQITSILVQMIEIADANRSDQVLGAAGTWAMDTLLSLGDADKEPSGDALQESAALQKLKALTFTTTCSPSGPSGETITSWLVPWLNDGERHSALDPTAAAEVLELVATLVGSDEEFLDASEALLGEVDCVSLGNTFLGRISRAPTPSLSDTSASHGGVLFDLMSLRSKTRVWGNDPPSWRRQLLQWLLAAHREPFRSIGSILSFQSPLGRSRDGSSVQAWSAAFQQYSHLYVMLVGWAHEQASLLGSCRSIELLGTLAVFTRPAQSTNVFGRSIVDKSWSADPAFWTLRHRVQRFIALEECLKRHERECARLSTVESRRKTLAEWIGIAERPHLVLEAMEMLFHSMGDQGSLLSGSSDKTESLIATGITSAERLLGWFYAHISPNSTPAAKSPTEEAAMVVASIRANLSGLKDSARWLQLNRATFSTFSTFRLRLVWFWLLKFIHNPPSSASSSRHNELNGDDEDTEWHAALVTSVLESIEYAFRRFAPSDRKRAFQVEVMAQFIVDLEWRSHKYWSSRSSRSRATMTAYVDRIGAVLEWLTKIVRLMQVDELKTRDDAVNDVEHLAERLRQLFAVQD